MGVPEKIKAIQDEIHRTQLNKATEHHIGLLKAKIAKLKREQEAIAIKNKPTIIIAKTIKGKGVSFMENKVEWHYKSPKDDELKKAIFEIKNA